MTYRNRDWHDKRAYRQGRLRRGLSEVGYVIGWLWYAGKRRLAGKGDAVVAIALLALAAAIL